jgi:hypothetical protein
VVPLVQWGLIEQNVVLVAACIPTLRPFFHKESFRPRGFDYRGNNSRSRSGASSSFELPSHRKYTPSNLDWKLPRRDEAGTETNTNGLDAESEDSQQGIWRALDYDVSSGKELDPEHGADVRKFRSIVPSSLRD